jgi:hypothetical protein
MATVLQVYIGRGNTESISLRLKPVGMDDYQDVEDDSVLRAVFRFSDYCLDTDTDVDGHIALAENATVVELKPGLISGLVAGQYAGWLTIYDALNPDGIAWGEEIIVNVRAWSSCPA